MANIRDIRFLVISGGGAAGYGHGGALEQLGEEPEFSYDKLEGVVGTSVGALIGLLVALRCSPQEMVARIKEIDFKKFSDGGCSGMQFYRLFNQYGRFRGEALYSLILKTLAEKSGRNDPENITFADMRKAGCIDFHVITTKMVKENGAAVAKQKVFSFEKSPHTSVAAVIRASAAAPLYFPRVRLKKVAKGKYVLDESGDLYDDGGIFNNYAIDYFDKPKYMGTPDDNSDAQIYNPHTLGLVLLNKEEIIDEKHKPIKEPIKDNQPVEFARSLINSLMSNYEMEKLRRKKNRARTIEIDRKGVKLDDFGITEDKKAELFESGKFATKNHFAKYREMKAINDKEIVETKTVPNRKRKRVHNTMWEKPVKPSKSSKSETSHSKSIFSCTII